MTGTGTLNGMQVIFIGDKSYYLNDVMAVGRLPDKGTDLNPDGSEKPTDPVDPDKPTNPDKPTDPADPDKPTDPEKPEQPA